MNLATKNSRLGLVLIATLLWMMNAFVGGDTLNSKPSATKLAKPIRRLTLEAAPGWTIFDPAIVPVGGLYRYGPTMLMNPDGSIDAFFSAPGGSVEDKPNTDYAGAKLFGEAYPYEGVVNGMYWQWDWIRHQKLNAEGKPTSPESVVLRPVPGSAEKFSTCDPGVVKMGAYYYLGTTGVDNEPGNRNEVFVARSTSPTGPYEKWNGSGWGGTRPMPLVPFHSPVKWWGAGEPSFVRVGKTLFIYYTIGSWPGKGGASAGIDRTMVATAPADDENWPAKLTFIGPAWDRIDAEDSADVKYIPAYKSFIAVSTASRFTANSFIAVRTSRDGITWSEAVHVNANLRAWISNCGISANPEGHIDIKRPVYLGYAYSANPGLNWAFWCTNLHPVKIMWEK